MKYEELGTAMAKVRDSDTWWAARYCCIFLVLTGVRSGEAREAVWEEVDLDERIWTIPATRMKAEVEHKVPLSVQVMEILLHARDRTGRTEGPIFPPERRGNYMRSGILSGMLKRLQIPAVPHGSRQSFRNWAGGKPAMAQPAAEMVLAHQQSTEIEKAYLTSTFLRHRGPIMQEWADALEDYMGPVIAATDRETHSYSWSTRTPKKGSPQAPKATAAQKPKKTGTQDEKQQRSQAGTQEYHTPESPTVLRTEALPKHDASHANRQEYERRRSKLPERKEAMRAHKKELRDNRKAAGLCVACGAPPILNQAKCEECAEKYRKYNRKSAHRKSTH